MTMRDDDLHKFTQGGCAMDETQIDWVLNHNQAGWVIRTRSMTRCVNRCSPSWPSRRCESGFTRTPPADQGRVIAAQSWRGRRQQQAWEARARGVTLALNMHDVRVGNEAGHKI